jgi:transcriptional regulator with XRE-family HTH domain
MEDSLGQYLRRLRVSKGLTLHQVGAAMLERGFEKSVSGNYLAMVERSERKPSKRLLSRLAEVYETSRVSLFHRAGYELDVLDEDADALKIEWAYRSVIGDPDLPHARSLANVDMPLDGMRTIVELYSRATGIELLGGTPRPALVHA